MKKFFSFAFLSLLCLPLPLFAKTLPHAALPHNCGKSFSCLLGQVKKCLPAIASITGKVNDPFGFSVQTITTLYTVKGLNGGLCTIESKITADVFHYSSAAKKNLEQKQKKTPNEIAAMERQMSATITGGAPQICNGKSGDVVAMLKGVKSGTISASCDATSAGSHCTYNKNVVCTQ